MAGAGYGGELTALNIETPDVNSVLSTAEYNKARADAQRTQSQLAAQILPTDVAKAQSQLGLLNNQVTGSDLQNQSAALGLQSSALQLAQQKQADLVKTQQINQGLIANAAALSASPDEWDAKMQKLANAGVAEAAPLVGQYSERLQQRIVGGYAQPPQTALAATTGIGPSQLGGNPAGPGISSGAQPTDWTRQFAGMNPQQLQQHAQGLQSIDAAISRVEGAKDPAAQWAIEAPQFGFNGPIDPAQIPAKIAQLKAEIEPAEAALHGQMLRAGVGIAPPTPVPEVKEAGGALYSVSPQAPGGPTANPITPVGQSILIGTDPKTGAGVYRNSITGVESVGDHPLGAKPGTNRQSVYEQKLQSALAGGMTHDEAMAYANGTKAMGPQQAMVAAASAAARDAATASLSGGAPVDETALRNQYYQEFTAPPVPAAAGSPGAPLPPAAIPQPFPDPGASKAPAMANPGSAPPARALAHLQAGKITPFGNGQQWTLRNGKPVRIT